MVDIQNFNLVPNDDEEEFLVDFGEVTQVSTSDFNKLENRPSYNNTTMTGDTNIPKVPASTSELDNDSDFQTGSEVESAISAAIGAIDIPSKTSDLTNDGADGTSTYVEADDLAQVATTGNYNDLNNKPSIPAAQVNSDWNATSGVAEILNKPTIPTVNDATLTITQNGTSKGTFTANDADDTTIELTDTTYTAGNAISIDNNNAISADIYPEDFFTANATVTGTGSEIDLQKTLPVKLVNIELDGDAFQQNYSGKNLWSFNTGTFTNNSGSSQTQTHTDTTLTLTAVGTTGAQFITWITPELDSTKTYTISGKAKKIVKGTDGQPYIRVAYSYSDDGSTWSSNSNAYNNTSVTQGEEYSFSYTLPSGHKYYRLRCYNNTGTPVTIGENTTYYDLQLEANTIASAFEPYVGGIAAPNPDYPQNINVVTGTQTITATDGDSQSQTYTIDLGSIELCKIGDYQDYIYKSGNDWYVHKEIDKYTFNGTETWSASPYGTNSWRLVGFLSFSFDSNKLQVISNIFTGIKHADRNTAGSNTIYSANNGELNIRNTNLTTESQVQTATNGNYVYYALAIPTDTKITDAGLIAQLDAIGSAKTYSDTTNIVVRATGTNLPVVLEVAAYTNSLAGIVGYLGDMA